MQFITAHAHNGQLPDDLDWRALCDTRASSVVYMGARTCAALAERLLAHGIDPATPVIVVERATWPDERRSMARSRRLPPSMDGGRNPAGPCIILIGMPHSGARGSAPEFDATRAPGAASVFAARPLDEIVA